MNRMLKTLCDFVILLFGVTLTVIFIPVLAQGGASDSQFRDIDRKEVEYKDGNVVLRGFLARNPLSSAPRPTILIVHDANGRDDYENGRALQIAQLGYIGFAVDMFGSSEPAPQPNDTRRAMTPFMENRTLVITRLEAALRFIRSNSFVDTSKMAVMGYCFGGLVSIDAARAGLNFLGVVSFHGNLKPPPATASSPAIKAKVLVLTGYEDPGVDPKTVQTFQEEMKERNADWHMVTYGNTVHSFTEPKSNTPGRAMYNPVSDRRSWIAMKSFFREIFEENEKASANHGTISIRKNWEFSCGLLLAIFLSSLLYI